MGMFRASTNMPAPDGVPAVVAVDSLALAELLVIRLVAVPVTVPPTLTL